MRTYGLSRFKTSEQWTEDKSKAFRLIAKLNIFKLIWNRVPVHYKNGSRKKIDCEYNLILE